MTGRNPEGIEGFPSPGCSDVACGSQRLNAIIGAYEAFLDPVRGADDLSFRLALELPAAETPSARRHLPAPNWMIWERHHIEVVRAAATGNATLGARVGITGRARQARAARLAPGRAERYWLATYWLPVAPGWLSWRALPRPEYV